MSERTLKLYSAVTLGTPAPVSGGNVTEDALGWSRSINRDGGYLLGGFTLLGSVQKLTTWFYEYLSYHFEEASGGYKTWEGLVYEMDLTIGGATRRRTLDRMFNYVTSQYIDEDNFHQTSAAAESTESQARYGKREEILILDGYLQAAAEGQRDTFLAEYAWPYARAVGGGAKRAKKDQDAKGALPDNRLEVKVCGYILTANWRFESIGDATEDNLSDWISEIIATNCEFLSSGTIESNTRQVKKETNLPMRAYDVINELTSLGNSNLPARFYVDNDRRAYYRTISTTPSYFLRDGVFYTTAGGTTEINPWQLKPGVVRDMDYPIKKTEYGAWLDDARDFYISEFEVSDAGVFYKTDEFDESELLANQLRYEKMLEEMAEREEREANQ